MNRKFKKLLSIPLAVLVMLAGAVVLPTRGMASPQPNISFPTPSPSLIAKPTPSIVLVDGKDIEFDAYSINDNNYFKLRDLAYILNGTEKQFDVGWDGEKNTITLTAGEAYTAVGNEMQGKGTGYKTPTPTGSTVYIGGREVSFTAYNIEGNNYFKLRDIAVEFNFSVNYINATKVVVIDTSKEYGNTLNSSGITGLELERAAILGIGEKMDDETITYEQFFKLLDNGVELAAPSKVEKWKETLSAARTSNRPMTRSDAFVAVYYAAEALGERYYSLNIFPWGELLEKMGNRAGASFKAYDPKLSLFPGLHERSLLTWEDENWSRFFAAYIYSTARCSQISGRIIFDYDEERNSMRPDELLTYKEASLAALRLYDSGIGF